MYWRIRGPLGSTKLLLVAPLTAIKQKIKDGNPLSYLETKKMEKHDLLERCNRMVWNFKQSHMCVGLTIAVSVNGSVVWQKDLGVSDVENNNTVTSDWKLQIASITKLFTSHLMMRYVEKNPEFLNKSLHDVIGNYPKTARIHLQERNRFGQLILQPKLVEYKFAENCPLPIFSLLAHTSGLTHHTNSQIVSSRKTFTSSTDAFNATKWLWTYFMNFPAAMTWCGRGLQTSYTSYGTNLLGVILERVQPLTCQDLLLDLCAELDLQNTSLFKLDEEIFDYKNGYGNDNERTMDVRYGHGFLRDLSIVYPSEGLVSVVGDLIKFGEHYAAMFKSSSKVGQLKQETVEKIFSGWSGAPYPYRFRGKGLGWDVAEWVKKLSLCNDGGTVVPKASSCERSAGHGGRSPSSQAYLLVTFCRERDRRLFQLYPGANFVPPEVRSRWDRLDRIYVADAEPGFRHQVLPEAIGGYIKRMIYNDLAKVQRDMDELEKEVKTRVMAGIDGRIKQAKERLDQQLERYSDQFRDAKLKIDEDQASGRFSGAVARELVTVETERYIAACDDEKDKYKSFLREMQDEYEATAGQEINDRKQPMLEFKDLAEGRLHDQLEFDRELEARYMEGEPSPMVFGTCEYDHNPEERDRPVLSRCQPKGNTVVVAAIVNGASGMVQELCYELTQLFQAYYFDDNFVQSPKPNPRSTSCSIV